MSIICGTDFSPSATEAVRAAAALAAALDEPLALVHVIEERGAGVLRRDDPGLEELAARLSAEAEPLRKRLTVREVLRGGSPAKELAEEARIGGHLIVVGAAGAQARPHRLGRVAEKIAALSPIPVLVARGAEPFERFARGERPLGVLLGADASAPAQAALHWLERLRRHGPCEITAAQIYHPLLEQARLGIQGPQFSGALRPQPEIEQVLREELGGRVQPLAGDGPLRLEVRASLSDPAVALIELAGEMKSDLILVGSHRRKGLRKLWHGSTSQTLLREAEASVLCVPAERWPSRRPPPPRIQRVLVPTDLSELGNLAVPYAYSALPEGGVVHLLHIARDEEELRLRASLEGRLLALAPPEAEELGIETRVEVIPSAPTAEAIYPAAERHGVDLICMGSRGYGALHGALSGSVAQAVMGLSRRPLLVIRPPLER